MVPAPPRAGLLGARGDEPTAADRARPPDGVALRCTQVFLALKKEKGPWAGGWEAAGLVLGHGCGTVTGEGEGVGTSSQGWS